MHSSVDFASLCVGRICVSEDANVARQLSFFCLSLSLSDLSCMFSLFFSLTLSAGKRGRGEEGEPVRARALKRKRTIEGRQVWTPGGRDLRLWSERACQGIQ
jgi:hypothetical protein